MKVLLKVPTYAQCYEFVEPGHEKASAILPDRHQLGRLAIERLHEPAGVKTMWQERPVLPEQLVKNIVSIEIQGRYSDATFRLTTTKGVCTK